MLKLCHVRNQPLENKILYVTALFSSGNGSPCRHPNHFWVPQKSRLRGVKVFFDHPPESIYIPTNHLVRVCCRDLPPTCSAAPATTPT